MSFVLIDSFTLRIIIVAIGVVMGVLIQSILTLTIANGEWDKLSPRNRAGIRLSGGVAALLAGLWRAGTVEADNLDTVLFSIWFWQMAGASMGAEGIRLFGRVIKDLVKK